MTKVTVEVLRTKLASVTRSRDRLQGYVWAAESSLPDSQFSRAEVAHRKRVKRAQDAVFGSREEMRELLSAAVEALRWYADQPEGERAKITLKFIT